MADQNITALPKKKPADGDYLLGIGTSEEYQMLLNDLADVILNKLTSKTFALDAGTSTLISALNTLNSNTKMEQGTIISSNESINNNGSFLYKIGRIVCLNIRVSYKTQISAGSSIDVFSLPSGFKPKGYLRFTTSTAGTLKGEFTIESDGSVKFVASTNTLGISDGTVCVFFTQ